jgi:hypothetical protein
LFGGCDLKDVSMKNVNTQDNKGHRKHERFPFREDIFIDGVTQCTSADISEGGLFISTIQRFEYDPPFQTSQSSIDLTYHQIKARLIKCFGDAIYLSVIVQIEFLGF